MNGWDHCQCLQKPVYAVNALATLHPLRRKVAANRRQQPAPPIWRKSPTREVRLNEARLSWFVMRLGVVDWDTTMMPW